MGLFNFLKKKKSNNELNENNKKKSTDKLKKNNNETNIKIVNRNDWQNEEMPEENETFILKRSFTEQEKKALSFGHIPEAMEDKWFWYMEGNKLYAHRSWTGICIFIVEISEGDEHKVIVNRNKEQYGNTDIEEDICTLNNLLNWWTQQNYDYYGQFICETAKNLENMGMISKSESN